MLLVAQKLHSARNSLGSLRFLLVTSLHQVDTTICSLTHACDDALHREARGGVIHAGGRQPFAVLLLLFEDEGRVLLFSDVDVVAGVCGRHDVARTRVQKYALIVFSLCAD